MPLKDENLTREFNLLEADLEKLQSDGWSDQGSTNYHYGLPRKKNLWAKRITPTNQCSHATIWLFVFLYLSSKNAIKKVETSVHQVFNDGRYDEFKVPFFPPDQETAVQEIRGILK